MGKYLLDNVHLVDNPTNNQITEADDIIDLAKNERPAFSIFYAFFTTHAKNSSTLNDLEEEIEFEVEEYEDLYDVQIDQSVIDSIINHLKKIHKPEFNRSDYYKVMSLFQEFLVKEWKLLSSNDIEVCEEPTIYHKRAVIFKRKKYKNSKCDIVCIDKNARIFEAYECKTTMKTFYSNLNKKINTTSNRKKKKERAGAKNKQDYLCGLIDFFSNKFITNKVNVQYVTFFASQDIPKYIGKVPVFSLQKIKFDELI